MSNAATSVSRNGSIWKTHWPGAFLFMADIVGFSVAWKGAWFLRRELNHLFDLPINEATPYNAVFPLMVAIGIGNAALFGHYRTHRRLSSIARWDQLIKAGYHYLLYMMVVGYFLKELDLGRSVIMIAAAISFCYLWLSRVTLRALKARAFRAGHGLVRTAIVGTGKLAVQVRDSLQWHPEVGFDLVGFLHHPAEQEPVITDVVGSASDLERFVRENAIEELFIAVPDVSPDEQLNLISLGQTRGLRIELVSNLFGVITSRAKVDEIAAFPVITLRDGHLSRPQAIIKRLFDLVVSSIGLVLWFFLLHWWIAILIKLDSPGPVFFTHTRIGRDGRPFQIHKYRTMHADSRAYQIAPVENSDPRVTRVGRWLRKTSLDEFPQFINVLLGDMSMVGPRPEMPFIVQQYEPWQRRRLDVKPGITGLWQVIGRKNLPLHLNMEYDFYYIMNQSLLLDIEILIRTVPAVLKGKGAF